MLFIAAWPRASSKPRSKVAPCCMLALEPWIRRHLDLTSPFPFECIGQTPLKLISRRWGTPPKKWLQAEIPFCVILLVFVSVCSVFASVLRLILPELFAPKNVLTRSIWLMFGCPRPVPDLIAQRLQPKKWGSSNEDGVVCMHMHLANLHPPTHPPDQGTQTSPDLSNYSRL